MIYYAVVFLVIGLVGGLLNLAEGSLVVIQMSCVLFLMGVALIARGSGPPAYCPCEVIGA